MERISRNNKCCVASDVTGWLIYFSVAYLMLRGRLL
jgi:hypothetical protein